MSHTKELFLDHAATTPAHPDVVGLMLPYFGNHFGIPSSTSTLGTKARKTLEDARSRVAALINATPSEIVFTSGATESNNLAILGAVSARRSRGRHIITQATEHPSVLNACRHLEKSGFEVSYLDTDEEGRVDPGQVRQALRDDTVLISIMHASHETGVVQPVEEIGAIARDRDIIFHCDAVQSAGKVSIDVRSLPVDLMSLSSHKLYGPKGAGALFIRTGTVIDPVLFGSGQEQGLRPGTPNIPCIAGFGLACLIALRDLPNNSMLVTSLRESLEQQVANRIDGARVNGSGTPRLPHISSISFDGVRADDLAACLDAVNIVVSPRYGRGKTSPALAATGLDERQAQGTIRLSLGWENKEREIRRTVEGLEKAVERIRSFARASNGKDVTVFTFPDRDSAGEALRTLSGTDTDFSLVSAPPELAGSSCSHISLACLSSSQVEVGALLGESGIELAGMHKTSSADKPMSRKERDFWDRVNRIRKGE